MMRLSYIARRNLASKPLQTALSVILLAFGVGMVSLMMLAEQQMSDQFERNIKDIDLVLGAKGSPLQLILANVYHVDAPTGNISLAEAEKVIRNPYIESGIPLAYGDNYRSFRIVGTEHSYPAHYDAIISEGILWEGVFDVTLGNAVASKTGLKVGDEFFSSHGLKDETDVHENKAFTVVGILAQSNSVIDKLILTGVESVWGVHAEHDDLELSVEELYASREITAVLLKKRNPMAILTLPNLLRETNMQVALPAIEINRLNQQFGIGAATLRSIALLIMILSFASIFISVFENMQARRYELALMRTMGGTPLTLIKLLLLEGGILSLFGTIFGLIISRIGLYILAAEIENKFQYDLGDIGLLAPEILLALFAILVGLIAAALPAFRTLRMDISKTLSNE
jgi:putative ABC transport system permease protein